MIIRGDRSRNSGARVRFRRTFIAVDEKLYFPFTDYDAVDLEQNIELEDRAETV